MERKLSKFPNDQLGREQERVAQHKRRIAWRAAIGWTKNQFIGKSAFETKEVINKELRDL